ncbi:hypothetical protein [Nitrososphaera sp.]|uniref:hypothetical protein n=1 Tax=Nitrososphaera sp. TaxID=1971748 RepID=UPI0017DE2E7A|nr:hypothetical protein [Nitrososphaera sp.]NWG37090.1 hypothetical protein [Nitrososphaera sp.]
MRAPKGKHGDQLIDGAVLRGVIERGLAVIGASALRALFHDLEFGGIMLEQGKAYSLKDLSRALASLFGAEATEIMMDRIRRELARQG